jgi:MFS family permease
MGSVCYGYDFSVISSIIGIPAWYSYMGLTEDKSQTALYTHSNNMIGALFGLFSAGAIFGALFVGWMCDAYGRKKSLMLAAVVNIVGGALQAGSVHIGMFIAARFVTGFAAGRYTLIQVFRLS